MMTEIIKGFKALETVAEKISYLKTLKRTGADYGYDINLDNIIKAWEKYL